VADVTGAAMLRQLTTDLDQDGIRLAVAPDVGQARKVLAHAGGPTGGLLDRRRGRRRGAEPADAELIHEPC
jgi:hypothetical protein